jgi:SAM-dependent methyltransferase
MNDKAKNIPLEKNLNWWWYKSRLNLLDFIVRKKLKSLPNDILEIGPGLGNNIKQLNKYGSLDVLEVEVNFIKHLQDNFGNEINQIFTNLENIKKEYDLIVMLDVLEHIELSREFMFTLKDFLKEDGKIILSVPAYKFLYSSHDFELKHFRRYSWKTLKKDCENYIFLYRTGFNFLLLPFRVLQIKFFNNINSVSSENKFLESIFLYITVIESAIRKLYNVKFGLSLFAVLGKK